MMHQNAILWQQFHHLYSSQSPPSSFEPLPWSSTWPYRTNQNETGKSAAPPGVWVAPLSRPQENVCQVRSSPVVVHVEFQDDDKSDAGSMVSVSTVAASQGSASNVSAGDASES